MTDQTDEATEPTTKIATVTVRATGAWEDWRMRVPIDVDEAWVRENFDTIEDKYLHESGSDSTELGDIAFEPDADSTALTNRPPF